MKEDMIELARVLSEVKIPRGILNIVFSNISNDNIIHMSSDMMLENFELSELTYEPRNCPSYPHKYYIKIGKFEFFMITTTELHPPIEYDIDPAEYRGADYGTD